MPSVNRFLLFSCLQVDGGWPWYTEAGQVVHFVAVTDIMRSTTRAVFVTAHPYLPPCASKAAPRGFLRQAQDSEVAVADLCPTVALMGSSNVVGQVTATARQRQTARGPAFALRAAARHARLNGGPNYVRHRHRATSQPKRIMRRDRVMVHRRWSWRCASWATWDRCLI